MDKEQLKDYLRKNLKIDWMYTGDDLYITLQLEGGVISKIPFAQD